MATVEYTDRGIWIHGTTESASRSIQEAVFQFRSNHDLDDTNWQTRDYGTFNIDLDVWIDQPFSPGYREPFTIPNDGDAGPKVSALLEDLFQKQLA